jgi:hypothetical protein
MTSDFKDRSNATPAVLNLRPADMVSAARVHLYNVVLSCIMKGCYLIPVSENTLLISSVFGSNDRCEKLFSLMKNVKSRTMA